MKKKAIVVGGSGFVGSHVADALIEAGYAVTIFDCKKSSYLAEKQKFVEGNILDFNALQQAIAGHDYVYHFAGQADISVSLSDPRQTIELNVLGTTNLLEACKKHHISRFVFASTIYVYSDGGAFYRASKQACEIIIEEYQKQFGIDFTILRYGSLYGRRANNNNLIHRILKQAIFKKTIQIGYGMSEKRDYIHVKDAARNSVEILHDNFKNSHVMLTGYQQISREELVNMISEMLGGIKIEQVVLEVDHTHGHYKFTPYIFKPNISKKYCSQQYLEFGQGLLDCMDEIYQLGVDD